MVENMGMNLLHIDFETKSDINLVKNNAWVYSEGKQADIICMAYKMNNEPVGIWEPGETIPAELNKADYVIAHSALFEYAIIHNIGVPKYGFPEALLDYTKYICTAGMCRSAGLPGGLEKAGQALQIKHKKLDSGKKLIQKYCLPKKNRTTGELYFIELEGQDKKDMFEYCKYDVFAEHDIYEALKNLPNNKLERKAFLLDFYRNIRGLNVNIETVNKIVPFIANKNEEIIAKVEKLYPGFNVNSNVQLKKFLSSEGFPVTDAQEKTLTDIYKKVTPEVQEILDARLFLSRASIKKYNKLQLLTSPDGKLRHFMMYHGAHTGRDAGRGVQPHNFPKAKTKKIISFDELTKVKHEDIIDNLKKILPTMIIPEKGNKLILGDFSSIEARVLAYLAKEEKMMRAYNRGECLYRQMGGKVYHIRDWKNLAKESKERALGKSIILGCIAENTEVRTNVGFKRIQNVEEGDKLWNGKKFVRHHGLIKKGLKTVIKIEKLNIELTPGHWILTPNGWRTAVEIDLNVDTQTQILEIKSRELSLYQSPSTLKANVVSKCAAYAELRKNVELIDFGKVKGYFVNHALHPYLDKKAGIPIETLTSYLTQNLESVGLHVSTILNIDVRTIIVKTLKGMEVAGFRFASHPLENFWNTLLQSMGLINGVLHWTELITIDTMSVETYELYLKKKTMQIKETYDIILKDNYHMFQAGNCIVHNCGYGMGKDRFYETCLSKSLDISYDLAVESVLSYRSEYSKVPKFWYDLEGAFKKSIMAPGKNKVGIITVERIKNFIQVTLPSGRILYYHKVRLKGDQVEYWNHSRECYVKLWGGMIAENICQAVARDILIDRMVLLHEKGIIPILHVHDEAISEVPEKGVGESLIIYNDIMNTTPDWLPGFPLVTESEIADKYYK